MVKNKLKCKIKNIETVKKSEFLNFYNRRFYNANCFGSLNKNYHSFKSTDIIDSIFEAHWNKTYYE